MYVSQYRRYLCKEQKEERKKHTTRNEESEKNIRRKHFYLFVKSQCDGSID